MTVEVLTQNGLRNADSIVKAASEMGIELAIAAAFAEQESNGYMVYGHDAGGTFSTAAGPVTILGVTYAKGSNIEVTSQNYWGAEGERGFYNRVVTDVQPSNGVGIFQITYRGFISQARTMGYDLAIPLDNCRYGLWLIKGYLKGLVTEDQVKRAACHYNTGSETGYLTQWYALQVWDRVKKWRGLLSGSAPVPVEPAPVEPVPTSPWVSGYRYTTSYLNFRSGPTTEYSVIGVIPRNVKVGISGVVTGGWYQVCYEGKWGWVSGKYLSATPLRKRK